jgi:hypothetical protein
LNPSGPAGFCGIADFMEFVFSVCGSPFVIRKEDIGTKEEFAWLKISSYSAKFAF